MNTQPRNWTMPILTYISHPRYSMKWLPELADTLDYFKVPESAKQEVLAAFSAHKPEVTAGSRA